VDLPGTHDPTGAGRLVHPWAHASQDAVLKAAVSPVAPKVVATSAVDSTAHHRVVISIANDTSAVPKVADSNVSASQVRPITDVVNVTVMRAAQNGNAVTATGLPVLRADMGMHADREWTATASPAHPSIGSKAAVRRGPRSIRV